MGSDLTSLMLASSNTCPLHCERGREHFISISWIAVKIFSAYVLWNCTKLNLFSWIAHILSIHLIIYVSVHCATIENYGAVFMLAKTFRRTNCPNIFIISLMISGKIYSLLWNDDDISGKSWAWSSKSWFMLTLNDDMSSLLPRNSKPVRTNNKYIRASLTFFCYELD